MDNENQTHQTQAWRQFANSKGVKPGQFCTLPSTKQKSLLSEFKERTQSEIHGPYSQKTIENNIFFTIFLMEEHELQLLIQEQQKLNLIQRILEEKRRLRRLAKKPMPTPADLDDEDEEEAEEQIKEELLTLDFSTLKELKDTLKSFNTQIPAIEEQIHYLRRQKDNLEEEQKELEKSHENSQIACIVQALTKAVGGDPNKATIPERHVLRQMTKNIVTAIDHRAKGPDFDTMKQLNLPTENAAARHKLGSMILLAGEFRHRAHLSIKQSIGASQQLHPELETLRGKQQQQEAELQQRIEAESAVIDGQLQVLSTQILTFRTNLNTLSKSSPVLQGYVKNYIRQADQLLDEVAKLGSPLLHQTPQEEIPHHQRYTSPTPFRMTPRPPFERS